MKLVSPMHEPRPEAEASTIHAEWMVMLKSTTSFAASTHYGACHEVERIAAAANGLGCVVVDGPRVRTEREVAAGRKAA